MASRKTSLIRVTPTNADDVTVTRSLPRTNSSRKLSRNKLSLSQTLPSNELFVRRRTSCISLPATTQSFGRKSSTAESIAERASATEPDGAKGGDRRDSCQRRGPVGGEICVRAKFLSYPGRVKPGISSTPSQALTPPHRPNRPR